ncbi:ABC transporter [Paramicrobacterium chengjingii]|uniref:ABC transporter n=1 Tax=Paramicrobacterium chengjingii TaxID=2769067 RepID=A0ABX6YIG7_9MICO|nr:ABC transporter [Microbacterium chengjingii]QPZ38603.1 ABC transporter [Microbacterium chengjingii]
MSLRRPLLLASTVVLLLATSACSAATSDAKAPPGKSDDGHGAVAGAVEAAEPPLQLVSIDESGAAGVLDLLDGETTMLGEIGAPHETATDGRYVFATTDAGIEVIDSGVWTWDHVDHFHYYRGTPTIVGTVKGKGPVTVATGMLSTAGGTVLRFDGSSEVVLIDNDALSKGEIEETFRLDTGSTSGIAAPVGSGAIVSDGDTLRFYEADGTATDVGAPCIDPVGTITTRVGLAIGCADGAVIATADDGQPEFERAPYPEGVEAERATAFDGRKGRPTVAAIAGNTGFWLLDTREASWKLVETDAALVRVTAVDDEEGHVIALDEGGRVLVYQAESGEQISATEPLLSEAFEREQFATVTLVVDGQRAYLNAPVDGVVHEIAYADGARIARTLETPTHPVHMAEVGR